MELKGQVYVDRPVSVTHLEENRRHMAVTRSGEFKWAEWDFTLDPHGMGTAVKCITRFSLRLRFALLAPVLGLVGEGGVAEILLR
jgi:hypothetical protein